MERKREISNNETDNFTTRENRLLKRRKGATKRKRPVEEIIDKAYSNTPFVEEFQQKFKSFHLTEEVGDRMPGQLKEFTFNLLKKNMAQLYGQEWSDRQKQDELYDPMARMLVVWHEDQPCAYVHFRFVDEEEVPVLYVYELQLETHIHRQGVGRWLDEVCAHIGAKRGMGGICLTVFKHNIAARAFYEALGYTQAPHSPGACAAGAQEKLRELFENSDGKQANHQVEDDQNYIIMCKLWSNEAKVQLTNFATNSITELINTLITTQSSDDGGSEHEDASEDDDFSEDDRSEECKNNDDDS